MEMLAPLTPPTDGARGGPVADTPLLKRHEVRPSGLAVNINLIRELAVAAFKLKYAGSVLGYLWSLVKPALVFGMMYLFFAVFLLRGRTQPGENFPVELLLGVVIYTFFAEATGTSLMSVVSNGDMIRKAYFPRWILVAAATLSATMTLLVNLALVLIIGLSLGWYHVGWQSLTLIPLVVELYAFTLGLGLILGALCVPYRDLGHIWEIVLQFLFYASAILFPFSLVPHGLQFWAGLNPLAQIIEDVRRALVSPLIPWTYQLLGVGTIIPAALVALSVVSGFSLFRHLSRRFAEGL